MRDSILYASLRAFMIALFSMTGIFLALIPIAAIFSVFSKDTQPEAEYDVEIVANADGVRKKLSQQSPAILQMNINGVIGLEGLTQQSVRQMLIESREADLKDRVKGILLVIESPGGTVLDSDGIYEALKDYKAQYNVPVYAYVDGLCASGGIYVASAADKIYASDISLIGSVGVLSPSFLNVSQLIEKVGVQALTLSAGKGKDELNPLRPWKPGEQDHLQNIIDDYYLKFVDIVATNRPEMNKQLLMDEYGAKIYTAPIALKYGYIDGSGYSRNEALKLLLKEAGIEGDDYQVVQMGGKSWLTTLLTGQAMLLSGKIKHEIKLAPEFDQALSGKFLYLYR